MEKIRVDKWLWTVRVFKSRTLATDACKAGKVRVNSTTVKPSFLVAPGEVLVVKKNGFDFQFKVLQLLKSRVGAAIAASCYENLTSQEELEKYKAWYVGKAAAEMRERGSGRPTKKERREIDSYKVEDKAFDWEDWD